MNENPKNEPVQRACNLVGGMAKLARLVGVTPPAVSQWVHGLRRVPAERCIAVERITMGAIRCEELRPDLGWSVLRDHAG